MPPTTAEFDYDVIVIGAGPAGYAATIRSAQLGYRTANVDQWTDAQGQHRLGGTFVHAGCLACISLLESAKVYDLLRHNLAGHGLSIQGLSLDLPAMQARKVAIATDLDQQISELFEKYHITRLFARGRLLNPKQVEISPSDGASKVISAKYIILASGSTPLKQSCAAINNDTIINSTQALNLTTVPKTLGILGAGVIGLEIASIWQRLGAQVILLEAQNQFLPALDQDLARTALIELQAQGLQIELGARVIATKPLNNGVAITYQNAQGKHDITVDKLLVAAGRKPNSENLAAVEAQLLLDENGYVHVDEHCATNLPGVFAIGDLTALGSMLAHKGIAEGLYVAERIAGRHNPINYANIPNIIYTEPAIAWVGPTEQTLKAIGEPIKTTLLPLSNNAQAKAISQTTGVIKLITHANTDKILGVHMMGANAAELIAEAVLAMEFSASAEDLACTIHAHPSLSCVFSDAALMLNAHNPSIAKPN